VKHLKAEFRWKPETSEPDLQRTSFERGLGAISDHACITIETKWRTDPSLGLVCVIEAEVQEVDCQLSISESFTILSYVEACGGIVVSFSYADTSN
jgi:hypothetical protein